MPLEFQSSTNRDICVKLFTVVIFIYLSFIVLLFINRCSQRQKNFIIDLFMQVGIMPQALISIGLLEEVMVWNLMLLSVRDTRSCIWVEEQPEFLKKVYIFFSGKRQCIECEMWPSSVYCGFGSTYSWLDGFFDITHIHTYMQYNWYLFALLQEYVKLDVVLY